MGIGRHLLITGRAQGVGFRYFVQNVATRAGVTGYVMNLPDGCVEAFIQGNSEAVAKVESAARLGPAGARVESVLVRNEESDKTYDSFVIR